MTNENSHTDEPQPRSFFQIVVHSFFIIPFLIAVFCALLFGSMHLLTRENKTVYDYLEDIKVGGKTKRWHGAYELTRFLSQSGSLPDDPRFLAELGSAFREAKHDDPRVRHYLALAMGRTGQKEFTGELTTALKENTGSPAPLIYALGMLGDPRAGEAILPYLEHADPRIRSISVVALGSLETREYTESLKKMLYDEEPNATWGAAVALARKGDPSGKDVLLNMLSREYWDRFGEVDRDEENQMIRMAVTASSRLKNKHVFEAKIRDLAGNDPNMDIRAAAAEWISTDKNE